MKKISRKKPEFVEISMLNLIDVIFVMLIFFMLCSSFKHYWQFDVLLPKEEGKSQNTFENILEISLNNNKELFVKDKKEIKMINYEELKGYLNDKKIIILNADKKIDYGDVINLIAFLQAQNQEQIKLNIQR